MESAQDKYPYTTFQNNVIDFLKSLHESCTKPDLVQVEQGRITIHGNELTAEDSRDMMRRMGLER